jgi:hypothetical protein
MAADRPLWQLTEAASDLVFLDLPRRVAKILLSQLGVSKLTGIVSAG